MARIAVLMDRIMESFGLKREVFYTDDYRIWL